jgi:hypothetical protein
VSEVEQARHAIASQMGASSGQFMLQAWQTPPVQIERMGSTHSPELVQARQAPVAVSHTGFDSCGQSPERVHLAQLPSVLQIGVFAFLDVHAMPGVPMAILHPTQVPRLQIGVVSPLQLAEVRHPTQVPAVLAIPGRSVGLQLGVAGSFVRHSVLPWPPSAVHGTHTFAGLQTGRLARRVHWFEDSHSTQAPVAVLQWGSAPATVGSGYFAPHATTPVLQPTQTLRARSHRGVRSLHWAWVVHATHSPRPLQEGVAWLRLTQASAGAPVHETQALFVQMGFPTLGQSVWVRQSTHLPVVRWHSRVVAPIALARALHPVVGAVGSPQATQVP